jgi:protein SCO1/2
MLNLLKKIFLLFSIYLVFNTSAIADSTIEPLPIISGIGGDFVALNAEAKEINLSDFNGKVVVLAFGYTNCADICPFTLGYLKQLYATLSIEEQAASQFIFVTIDPEYDTPKHLNEFVTFFNKDFIGLSGSKAQIKNITALYQAEYSDLSKGKVLTQSIRRTTPQKTTDKDEKASLFSHTVVLYLIDKQGLTRSLEYTGTAKEDFASKIRILINETH